MATVGDGKEKKAKRTKRSAAEPAPAPAEVARSEPAVPEPRDARLVPTHEQVASRAFWHFLQGSHDAVANWHRAEREMEHVVNRAYALFLDGNTDDFANWIQATRELDA
jgi:hypothetical protein